MNCFCRRISLAAALIAVSVLICSRAGAEQVMIYYSGDGEESVFTVSLDEIKARNDVIRTVDPNFKEDGLTEFSGISLKRLLALDHIPYEKGLTVVGHDQYIGFVSASAIKSGSVIAACKMNGDEVPKGKGGPIKIVYSEESDMPISAYTWYVDTLYAGRIKNPVLKVANGTDVWKLRHEDFSGICEKLEKRFFSSPSGFRGKFRERDSVDDIKCVSVENIFGLKNIQADKFVEFIPSAGPSVKIPAKLVSKGVKVVYRTGKNALHPVYGGPYSVMFPLEVYPEMAGSVPESGALFFLKKISVH